MRFLYVIDPLDTLNLDTETTLLIAEEAQRRGHEGFVAEIGDLFLDGGRARVRAAQIEIDMERRPFHRTGAPAESDIAAFDLALMRKDPPVDASYVAATFVLERAAKKTSVVNDPVALRTVSEKLFPLAFPGLAPLTLFTADRDRIAAFVERHGRSILKPLSDCSGRGIRVLQPGAPVPEPGAFVVVQQFLPAVEQGDKRILLLSGEILGAVNRVPRGPEALANIHQGARVEAAEITARDREIVAAIGPELVRRGLWMAGIDVIGGHLIEVNVTSPSAARQINAVSGTRVECAMVDFLERRAAGRG